VIDSSGGVNPLVDSIVTCAMNSGDLDRHVIDTNKEYGLRSAVLVDTVRGALGVGSVCYCCRGAGADMVDLFVVSNPLRCSA